MFFFSNPLNLLTEYSDAATIPLFFYISWFFFAEAFSLPNGVETLQTKTEKTRDNQLVVPCFFLPSTLPKRPGIKVCEFTSSARPLLASESPVLCFKVGFPMRPARNPAHRQTMSISAPVSGALPAVSRDSPKFNPRLRNQRGSQASTC